MFFILVEEPVQFLVPIHGVFRKPERQKTNKDKFILVTRLILWRNLKKQRGKLILDLRPNILENDRFVTKIRMNMKRNYTKIPLLPTKRLPKCHKCILKNKTAKR